MLIDLIWSFLFIVFFSSYISPLKEPHCMKKNTTKAQQISLLLVALFYIGSKLIMYLLLIIAWSFIRSNQKIDHCTDPTAETKRKKQLAEKIWVKWMALWVAWQGLYATLLKMITHHRWPCTIMVRSQEAQALTRYLPFDRVKWTLSKDVYLHRMQVFVKWEWVGKPCAKENLDVFWNIHLIELHSTTFTHYIIILWDYILLLRC